MSQLPELKESRVVSVLSVERASATPKGRSAVPHREVEPTHVSALDLAGLQRWFQTAITHPGGLLEGTDAAGEAAENVLGAGARTTALEGLAVYHHAYRARLIECLVDDYPALQNAMGDDAFAEHASSYITAHPSQTPNLNGFGKHMSAFCRDAGMPFAADLARLEWTLVEILHAADAEPLAEAELGKVAPAEWGNATLVPSETFRMDRFAYPVNAYFQAFMDDESPEVPKAATIALAIYRQGFRLWRMELTPSMADLLADLVRGVTLGEALGAMESRLEPAELEDAAKNLMAWFGAWVRGGFFQRVTFGG